MSPMPGSVLAEVTGRIHQLSMGNGGVPKFSVAEARVGPLGLEGDVQAERRIHGGPDKALCLYALECIEAFRAEGHSIGPGSAGENVTLAGIPWGRVTPGAQLELGREVRIVVTEYAMPCLKNARWFADGDFQRMNPHANPGHSRVYARVLRGGRLIPGDRAVLCAETQDERADRLRVPAVRWKAPQS